MVQTWRVPYFRRKIQQLGEMYAKGGLDLMTFNESGKVFELHTRSFRSILDECVGFGLGLTFLVVCCC